MKKSSSVTLLLIALVALGLGHAAGAISLNPAAPAATTSWLLLGDALAAAVGIVTLIRALGAPR